MLDSQGCAVVELRHPFEKKFVIEASFAGRHFVDFDDPANKAGPECPTKLRIIGDATIDETDETVRQFYGSQRIIRLMVKYVFPNCPRYLPSMTITDTSKYTPKPGYAPPKPEWKTRDYIVDVLDEDE